MKTSLRAKLPILSKNTRFNEILDKLNLRAQGKNRGCIQLFYYFKTAILHLFNVPFTRGNNFDIGLCSYWKMESSNVACLTFSLTYVYFEIWKDIHLSIFLPLFTFLTVSNILILSILVFENNWNSLTCKRPSSQGKKIIILVDLLKSILSEKNLNVIFLLLQL